MPDIAGNRGRNKVSKRPYMRLFTSDYRDGTATLDFELQGFYFRILTYLHDGETVPAEPSELARFLQCNARTVRKLLPKLIECGKLFRDGFELKNPRIERELEANSASIEPEFEPNSNPKIQKDESNQEGSDTYYRADHFHSHSHIQKEVTATSLPEQPREVDGRPDNLKLAFNGSTELLIADVMAWMGPTARRDNATSWLTGNISAFGAERTLEAWNIVTAKIARNELVSNPLALLAKTAKGIRPGSLNTQTSAKTAGAVNARNALDRYRARLEEAV